MAWYKFRLKHFSWDYQRDYYIIWYIKLDQVPCQGHKVTPKKDNYKLVQCDTMLISILVESRLISSLLCLLAYGQKINTRGLCPCLKEALCKQLTPGGSLGRRFLNETFKLLPWRDFFTNRKCLRKDILTRLLNKTSLNKTKSSL